jgi:hypothetical protein
MNTAKSLVSAKRLIVLLALGFFGCSAQAGLMLNDIDDNNDGSNGSCNASNPIDDVECNKFYFGLDPLVHTGTPNSSGVVDFAETILNASGLDWITYSIMAMLGPDSQGGTAHGERWATFRYTGDFSDGTFTDISFSLTFAGIDGTELLTLTQTPIPVRVTPMPEPATLALVGLALGGLGCRAGNHVPNSRR